MTASARPLPDDDPPVPLRLGPRGRVAFALCVVVVGLALSPVVAGIVDWGMDSRLTPGTWEPRYWLVGIFLSAALLGTFGWPLVLLTAIVCVVVILCRVRRRGDRCPACQSPANVEVGSCPKCGPLPPSRPRLGSESAPAVVATTVAWLAAFLTFVVAMASGISWVSLELEEDAFGERARAAAATKSTSHEERNRHGSLLGWSEDRGYWSHRD